MSARYSKALIALILLFFYLPIGILILGSFNDSQYASHWVGFSWRWYALLFEERLILRAFANSLMLGVCAATLATVLGFITSVCFFRYRFLGKKLLSGIILTLIIIPDIILGIALLVFYYQMNIPLGFSSLLIAHITFSLPFAFMMISSRLNVVKPAYCQAAIDLGASEWRMNKQIILPLIWPALLGAFLLCFTLSFDDLIISYFVSGPGFEILPLKIYALIRNNVRPDINALCTLTLGFSLTIVMAAQWLLKK